MNDDRSSNVTQYVLQIENGESTPTGAVGVDRLLRGDLVLTRGGGATGGIHAAG
jgi:hypothetical protein